ncbi:MAG: 4-hydroxythreonine-4-phosphate dehydrogenase PdxA [Thermoguttaceae bacterium]
MVEARRPRIAITLGDPAGIGPEVVAGVWALQAVHQWCRPVAVGHPEVLRRAAVLRGIAAEVVAVAAPDQVEPSPGIIPCVACGPSDVWEVPAGAIDPRCGQAAYEAVVTAARLALAGQVDAVATAPLHKQALRLAGHDSPGHTELLARLCGVEDFAMALYLGPDAEVRPPEGLAVVHVTLHMRLRDVFGALSKEGILAKARLADRFMRAINQGLRPRIGVCALNPHAGEAGLFGDEEQRLIRPAVEQGRAEGLDLEGPLPADTLVVQARDGQFDALVAMYHDQGHIALKLLGMHRAVNVTLGLPIIRTSVAHGTAMDLAWKGRAQLGSMTEALRVASRLAANRS